MEHPFRALQNYFSSENSMVLGFTFRSMILSEFMHIVKGVDHMHALHLGMYSLLYWY